MAAQAAGSSGFLNAGGEMSKLTQALDWSGTSLGAADGWPLSLRTSVSNMLRTEFPMLVLWGEDFTCFYNDAFRPSLGTELHPALGKRAQDVWTPRWDKIGPRLNAVLTTGKPLTMRDERTPVIRNGRAQEVYWTFCYSQILGDDGLPGGVLVTCIEMPHALVANRVYETVIGATPDLVYVFDLNYRFTYANRALLTMWGKHWDNAIGKGLRENGYEEWHAAMHEREIDHVAATGESVRGEVAFPHAVLGRRVYDYILVPVFNEKGEVEAVAGTTRDVSEMKQIETSLRESESRFRTLVTDAPVAMAVFRGDDYVADIANDAYLALVEKNADEFLNKPLFETLPEVKPAVESIIRDVVTTGKPYRGNEFKVILNRHGKQEICYVNFTYSALRGRNDAPEGFIVVANEVTEEVNARHKIEESEARFRTMAENSPVFIGVSDANGDWTYFNKAWIELTGRPVDALLVSGWTDFVHPEDKDRYVNLSLEALKVKGPFAGEFRVLNVDGEYRWLLAYGAPRFSKGIFQGYVSACTDITKQKKAQLSLQEKERALANAIELAALGTWKFEDGDVVLSKRHAFLYGLTDRRISFDRFLAVVAESDRENVAATFKTAMAHGSDGRIDIEYRVVNVSTGKTHIIHALGQSFFNDAGTLLTVEGTAQDVTVQRELQLALENEVHHRTLELAATNEELQAANEELVSINEELSESSKKLIRSNEELSQFAYVASHDLQEPVRKISVFVEMLYNCLEHIDDRSRNYLEKIDASANRMLNLIRDVLKHSQILNRETNLQPVDLTRVVADVEKDFDMLIEQHRGKIVVDTLPTVHAIEFQMNQLFSNLISNSIKFSSPERDLRIAIKAERLSDAEKLEITELNQTKNYVKISVQDNGIGFKQIHANQIFEIFQRLHARSEYSGTGIGLATCRKIVQNHEGHISAASAPGEGATFHIILPI